MAKVNKEKKEASNRIEIKKTQTPGKVSTSLFNNIQQRHPLEELYNPNPASSIETFLLANIKQAASDAEVESLAFKISLASNNQNNLLASEKISTSSNELTLLTEQNNPANLLAETPELLAPLPKNVAKDASKLAELNDPASRTPLQLLADLRKSKGTRVQVAIRIRPEIKQLIDMFMAKEGMNQQDFFEQSASTFIENQQKLLAELNTKDASLLAHNDLRLRTLYKTKPSIIHLYSAYAENPRWSANDDAKASALNEVDLRIVELGILQTLGNRKTKGKINSFGYFLPEIENFLEIEMPEEGIEAMLTINRKSFQRLTGKTVDLSFLNDPAE